MSIVIYTYSDPYHLPTEPYWEEIKSCPFFCASQTLVNGLKAIYRNDFIQGRVTTVQNLLNEIFPEWNKPATIIRQHAVIDQIMTQGVGESINPEMQHNLLAAFIFNREDVFDSIRVLFELKINPDEILLDKLTPEQALIVKVYQTILASKSNYDFFINDLLSEDEIDKALNLVMLNASKDECNVNSIPKDHLVIHGIHQFTPIMLRCIELLSKYKKVILLFNYQSQYSSVYQTWFDIYTAFDSPIHLTSTTEYLPNPANVQSYQGNLLADSLGKMINGQLHEVHRQDNVEILEFDNTTEFASYVATLYSEASKQDSRNPLYAMKEQIYSADSSVNNILKMYFPEQFGERQFLNYPLGHFFIAITNMWDSQLNKVSIRNLNDIRECFRAGIISEETPGELASIYGKVSALFEGCTDIDEMLSRLKKVLRTRKKVFDENTAELLSHISYYNIDVNELEKLQRALTNLNDIAAYFFEDFEKTSHNFREFYKKIRAYIQEQDIDIGKLGEEYADILRRVLERLEEAESIDASASFECLKATMSVYLIQETKPGKSANWIVRDFQQIDGDVLRSQIRPDAAIYHFACLTDEDINAVKEAEFTWPLDADFFEVAQEPVDWKCQVFVQSRKEYKNFKRYALLYGLEFNRSKFKLSYVKRDSEKNRMLYSLLKILGVKIVRYKSSLKNKETPSCSDIQIYPTGNKPYTEFDYYRYRICRTRFLNECLLEGDTVYKDTFLIGKYIEVWLENKVRVELEGMPISDVILTAKLSTSFDDLSRFFPFVQDMNRMDIINTVRNRLINGKTKVLPKLTSEQLRIMKIRELFIHHVLSDSKTHRNDVFADKFTPVSVDTVSEKLSDSQLAGTTYHPESDVWCQYCSNREICVACYAIDASKEV